MKREWSENPAKLKRLLKNFAEIIWEYDNQSDILYPAPDTADFYGLPPSIVNGAQGLFLAGILHSDYISAVTEMLHYLSNEEGTLTAEILARLDTAKDYRWYCVVFTSYWNTDENRLETVGLFRDIAGEVKMRLHLQHLANTDGLTGVYNASAGRQMIQNHLLQQRSHSRNVMFLFDLDNFKQINDTCGHCFGDEVLSQFAFILTSACRQEDTVFRIGGDEFGIFAYHTCDYSLVTRICTEVLARTAGIQTTCECISVSIGAAINRFPSRSYYDYYQAADRAMYQAKAMGKGRYATDFF